MTRSVRRRAIPGVGPKRAGSYHHGDLRRALLDAALALVEREGPLALTLRAVARLAGVSPSAPYRHFEDKESLLAAVAEEGLRTLSAWMREAAAAQTKSPVLKLQALGIAYVRFAASHPSYFRVMFGPGVGDRTTHPALHDATEEAFRLLLDGVKECQRAGVAGEGNARDVALAAWSMAHGLAGLIVDGQLPSLGIHGGKPERLAAMVTSMLLLGTPPRR